MPAVLALALGLALMVALCVPAVAAAAPGDLDSAWAGDGIAEPMGPDQDLPLAMYPQPDGGAYVLGWSSSTPSTVGWYHVLPSGLRDEAYGTRRTQTTESVSRFAERAPDGKIVAMRPVSLAGSGTLALARWNEDGTRDTTFNGGDASNTTGEVTLEFDGTGGWQTMGGLDIASDGSIAIVGWRAKDGGYGEGSIVRFASNGAPLNSFGGDGKVAVDPVPGSDVMLGEVSILSDGKILVTGLTTSQGFIQRYTPSGGIDSGAAGFGDGSPPDGTTLLNLPPGTFGNYGAIDVHTDGTITLAATMASYFSAYRLTPGGIPIDTFGGDGQAEVAFTLAQQAAAVDLQPDGAVVLTGMSDHGTGDGYSQKATVVRLTSTGIVDNTFAGDGIVTYGGGGGPSDPNPYANSVDVAVVQSGTRILALGHRGDNFANPPFRHEMPRYLATEDVAVNDAPNTAVSSASFNYAEGSGEVAVDPGFTVDDPENDSISGATVRIADGHAARQADEDLLFTGPQNGITGSYDDGTGVLTLAGTTTEANYQAALRSVRYVNTSQNPSGTVPIGFRVTDAGSPPAESVERTRSIVLQNVNDAPSVTTSGGDTPWPKGNPPVAVDPGLTVADVDGTLLEGATVRITPGSFQPGDELILDDTAAIDAAYDSGTGVLTLTGDASLADYQSRLRAIAYRSTNAAAAGTKQVEFEVDDAQFEKSAVATKNVVVGAAVPLAEVSPSTVEFGSLQVGAPASTKQVRLKNVGGAPLHVSQVTLLGQGGFAAPDGTGACVTTLAPDASCEIQLTFAAPDTSARESTLEFVHDAAGSPTRVRLTGSGFVPDRDGDNVPDATDNCPDDENPDQMNSDGEGKGDECTPIYSEFVFPYITPAFLRRLGIYSIPMPRLAPESRSNGKYRFVRKDEVERLVLKLARAECKCEPNISFQFAGTAASNMKGVDVKTKRAVVRQDAEYGVVRVVIDPADRAEGGRLRWSQFEDQTVIRITYWDPERESAYDRELARAERAWEKQQRKAKFAKYPCPMWELEDELGADELRALYLKRHYFPASVSRAGSPLKSPTTSASEMLSELGCLRARDKSGNPVVDVKFKPVEGLPENRVTAFRLKDKPPMIELDVEVPKGLDLGISFREDPASVARNSALLGLTEDWRLIASAKNSSVLTLAVNETATDRFVSEMPVDLYFDAAGSRDSHYLDPKSVCPKGRCVTDADGELTITHRFDKPGTLRVLAHRTGANGREIRGERTIPIVGEGSLPTTVTTSSGRRLQRGSKGWKQERGPVYKFFVPTNFGVNTSSTAEMVIPPVGPGIVMVQVEANGERVVGWAVHNVFELLEDKNAFALSTRGLFVVVDGRKMQEAGLTVNAKRRGKLAIGSAATVHDRLQAASAAAFCAVSRSISDERRRIGTLLAFMPRNSEAANQLAVDTGALNSDPKCIQPPPDRAQVVNNLTNDKSLGVIASGGGNVIASGGGNVIASGGGNIIASGGGNVQQADLGRTAAGGSNVVAGRVIASGGGNIIASGGGNLLGQAGTNLLGQAGTNLLGQAGTNLLGQAGTNAIPVHGGPLIGQAGTNLLGQAGTN